MFADAVAALLVEAGQDDVVVLSPEEEPWGHYDGAVVTLDVTGLDADVVIRLPDDLGGSGNGSTTTADGGRRQVELPDLRSVFDLLDRSCATARSRAEVLDDP
jgi:hypothetical protein